MGEHYSVEIENAEIILDIDTSGRLYYSEEKVY